MQQELEFEHGDISGELSISLANEQTLDDFCATYIPEYNRDRFEAMAIRVFVGKENIITVYAVDKLRQENSNIPADKIPVKKFKLEGVPLDSLFPYCDSFNCTLSTNNYPLDAMEVTNK